MSEVKRYDMRVSLGGVESYESPCGDYVDYEDYATLEVKCAALAAENAAFKDINAWCKTDAFSNMYREFKTAEAVGCCDIDCMHDAMVVAIMHAPETPDTDASLAEIENKAIRRFINSIEHILRDKLSPYDTEEMLYAMRIFLEEHEGEQK
ncbi:hypothetical protein KGB41_gp43 [Salmonella virus KFS-SE2]|uniref:Uncharacterized protein n=1 Tax=Salmonella virus KFS-SE2 TaxID=2583286 RepID=A0A4Y5TND8_9CAUD|nr:hypothetical protein KGB41_gp43 [Salmonella virus KFS-SE2]QDB70200.1 hypothetical protein [Salmonella virus KFS-SE2]